MNGIAIDERLLIRASAGTGKTYQLTNRFISRLLSGVPPSEMLAVTFTRNAAAEILDRVLVRLAKAADDPKEAGQLGEAIGEADLEPGRCRDLLGEVVDALQQLRVSTLDSYFNQVATSFSLELGLPVPWRMVDDNEIGHLKREAVRRVVSQGNQAMLRRLVNLLSGSDATRSVEDTLVKVVTELHEVYRETEAGAWNWCQPPPRPGRPEIEQAMAALQNAPLPEDNAWQSAHQKAIADVDAMAWVDLVKRGLGLKIAKNVIPFEDEDFNDGVVEAYRVAFAVLRADVINTLVDQTSAIHDVLKLFDEHFAELKRELRCVEFEDITRVLAAATLGNNARRLAHRLNAGVDHLLLDEFQDTSPSQWQVLEPLAREVTEGSEQQKSFFCVGDEKQAIFGWRGGVAGIFGTLEQRLNDLDNQHLSESYRSTPEVIETINRVFANLGRHDNLDQLADAVAEWGDRFVDHIAHHDDRTGYACLKTLPNEKGAVGDEAIDEIAGIIAASGAHDVGILARTNKTVSKIVSKLRQRGVKASQEGGFPLTDAAPVLALLSLTRLADHPADSLAAFHVASSPLGAVLGLDRSSTESDFALASRQVREELADRGYGAVIGDWARQLAAASDPNERFRLSQLVRLATRYDSRANLRPADFDRFVRTEGFGDPSTDPVRVMTIHQAKGLEFDVVILPELNSSLAGRTDMLSAHRPDPTSPPDRVLRTARKELRLVFREDQDVNDVYVSEQSRNATEALCVMYVAMTRARYALHILVPPSTKSEKKDKKLPPRTDGLLRASLHNCKPVEPGVVLFEHGNPQWCGPIGEPAEPVADEIPLDITLQPPASTRRRGRPRRAPSGLEGPSEVDVAAIFETTAADNMQHGTLVHAWLEQIEWVEQVPDDQALAQVALRHQIHVDDLPQRIATLRGYLAGPEILALLSEDSYRDPGWLPFDLQPADGDGLEIEVRNEYPFAIDWEDGLLNGTIDRLVLLRHGGTVVAADVIDFKTDHVEDQAGIDAKVAYYRGQLQAYRDAVGRVFGLGDEQIATRLAFLGAGRVVDV